MPAVTIAFTRGVTSRPPSSLIASQPPSFMKRPAFRIASSLSLVGAVVAEFYGSDRGLGFLVITSATQLQTDLLFVAIAVLAVLGVGCFAIFGRIERAYGAYQADHGYQR